MGLSYMTKEAREVADSILLYMIAQKSMPTYERKPNIELYNQWAHETNSVIEDANVAYWALTYIESCQNASLSLLKQAAYIDGLM